VKTARLAVERADQKLGVNTAVVSIFTCASNEREREGIPLSAPLAIPIPELPSASDGLHRLTSLTIILGSRLVPVRRLLRHRLARHQHRERGENDDLLHDEYLLHAPLRVQVGAKRHTSKSRVCAAHMEGTTARHAECDDKHKYFMRLVAQLI
jgi:hypothetical protein